MAQDFLRGMTLILAAREVSDQRLADLHRRLESVPDRGPAPVVVRTLESHLSKTALAPARIATTLVGASAATAVALGVLGLYGAMTDSVRRRRRELGVQIALGAPAWCVNPSGDVGRRAPGRGGRGCRHARLDHGGAMAPDHDHTRRTLMDRGT
jgi:hypothetical protein